MLVIADNLQITQRRFADAIRSHDRTLLESLVSEMERAGADAIDVNMGPMNRNAEQDMAFCLTTIQSVTELPILIDTANPLAMAAGLAANVKTAIINGISLEARKLDAILPLAVQYDVDVIGYLLDDHSHMPPHLDDRLTLAWELFDRCQSAGLRSEQLIIDPVVAPLIWQDGLQRNRDLLEIIRRLPEMIGFPVRTVAGLSNLTTGLNGGISSQRWEQTFLAMLAGAGLSWILLNIHHDETVASARISQKLLNDHIFASASIAGQ